MREYEPQHSYQDDLDTDTEVRDPFMDEYTDDPTEILGVPPDEYGQELDKLAIDEADLENEQTFEDARAELEDFEEDASDDTKAA